MPGEIIVLKPTGGAELTLSGAYSLDMEVDWGDHVIEPSLATGPDVVGGVVGVRQRVTTDATVPVRVTATTATSYLTAAEALSTAATELAQNGGYISRQVDFGGGNESVELETEVLACDLDPEDGWMQAHRLTSVVTLNITRNPAWLEAEETIATDTTFTDSVKRQALSERRGNLPGPAQIVLSDNASTARRFAEIGGAFTQIPGQVEYLPADFTLGEGSIVDDSAAGAIGGNALQMTSVLPAPQTIGTLESLPLVGVYRVRLRMRGGEDDSQFFANVVWRSGTGPWKELGWVSAPDAENYYDLDCGTILHIGEYASEDITVRVDVKSSAASSADFHLNKLDITPSELYVVARGVPVDVPSESLVAFDDFASLTEGRSLDDSDGAGTNRTAVQGGTWAEAGSGAAAEFIRPAGVNAVARTSADDGVGNVGTGYYAILGSTDYADIECVVRGVLRYDGVVATDALFGALVRYVDTNNWLIAAMRIRRQNDGKYVAYASLYKRVAGTITRLEQVRAKDTELTDSGSYVEGTIGVRVDLTGSYQLFSGDFTDTAGLVPAADGIDAVLDDPAGALKTGKVGAYSLLQSNRDNAYCRLHSIKAYGTVPASQHTDVIRDGGIGVLAHDRAYAADIGGSDPQPIVRYQGPRIWLPPGTGGEITAKVRSSDSEEQPDTGAGLDTAITITHRPAWAHLSDALEV